MGGGGGEEEIILREKEPISSMSLPWRRNILLSSRRASLMACSQSLPRSWKSSQRAAWTPTFSHIARGWLSAIPTVMVTNRHRSSSSTCLSYLLLKEALLPRTDSLFFLFPNYLVILKQCGMQNFELSIKIPTSNKKLK